MHAFPSSPDAFPSRGRPLSRQPGRGVGFMRLGSDSRERTFDVTSLNSSALPTLHIAVPSYDRAAASIGIVHFGFGNFHRSHQAMYVERLMDQGDGLDWGICGVGI